MSDSVKQDQRAGDHSINLQAGTIIFNGITATEAKHIALNVFKDNALKLAGIARDVFESRSREFVDRYLDHLLGRSPEALASFRDPDMQYALFTAQLGYARSGSEPVAEMLIDLLSERAEQKDRNLQQIVLSECLAVVPKLTTQQCDVITICFLLRYATYADIKTLDEFCDHLKSTFVPLCMDVPTEISSYQHLLYTGCASMGAGVTSIGKLLADAYPRLLCRGFTFEDVGPINTTSLLQLGFLIPCLHDSNLLQLADCRVEAVEEFARSSEIDISSLQRLRNLHVNFLMAEPEILKVLGPRVPEISELFRRWNCSEFKHLLLTSVGVAIAHSNIRRKLGHQLDLAIWIK